MKYNIKSFLVIVAVMAICVISPSTAGAAEKAKPDSKQGVKQIGKAAGTSATDLGSATSQIWQQVEKLAKPHLGSYTILSIEHSPDGKSGTVAMLRKADKHQVTFTLPESSLLDVKMASGSAEIKCTQHDGIYITLNHSDGTVALTHHLGLSLTGDTTTQPKKTAMTKLVPPPSKGS